MQLSSKFKCGRTIDLYRGTGFMDYFGDFGCDTSLNHSQDGDMELSLCDPVREFGICILT